MISFDEAIALISEIVGPLGIETVRTGDAHRRILARPVVARVDSPPADVSAMDGYALQEECLFNLPARLTICGESFAGCETGGIVEPGQTIRIFTGAPLPAGADRVVIQEMVRREDDIAVIEEHPGAARHIRRRGSDFAAGDVLLEPSVRLGYRELVAAAGADLAELFVWRRPGLIILGTGDELVAPGDAAGRDGAIPESVSLGVAALADEWGAEVKDRIHLPDKLDRMKRVAAESLEQADLIVVTGGASVGEKDFAKAMFGPSLELVFSKVSIKPGKPVWLGRSGGKLVMGLPGNPTSALVTARLFLAPLLARMTGQSADEALLWRRVSLLASLPACGDRETFVRARAIGNGVEPVTNQDSSAQKTLAEADLLIRRRAGAPPVEAGELVPVLSF